MLFFENLGVVAMFNTLTKKISKILSVAGKTCHDCTLCTESYSFNITFMYSVLCRKIWLLRRVT